MVIALQGSRRGSGFNADAETRRTTFQRLTGQIKIKRLISLSLVVIIVIAYMIFNHGSTTEQKQWRKWFYGDDRERDTQRWHKSQYPPSRNRPSFENGGMDGYLTDVSNDRLPIITIAGGQFEAGEKEPISNQPSSHSNPDEVFKSPLPGDYGCEWKDDSNPHSNKNSPLLLLAITSRRFAFKQRNAIRKAYSDTLTTKDKVKIQFFIREKSSSRKDGDLNEPHSTQEKSDSYQSRRLSASRRLSLILINTIRFFDPRNWFPLLNKASHSIPIHFDRSTEEGRNKRETWLESRLRKEMVELADVVELDVKDHDFSSFRAYSMLNHISRQDHKPAFVMKTDELTMVDVDRLLKSLADERASCERNIFWGSSSFTWHRGLNQKQIFGAHAYMLSWPLVAWLGNMDLGRPGPSNQGDLSTSISKSTAIPTSKSNSIDKLGTKFKGPETAFIQNWLSMLESLNQSEVIHVDWREELHGWLDIQKNHDSFTPTSLATRYLWRPEMWKQASEELVESRSRRRA